MLASLIAWIQNCLSEPGRVVWTSFGCLRIVMISTASHVGWAAAQTRGLSTFWICYSGFADIAQPVSFSWLWLVHVITRSAWLRGMLCFASRLATNLQIPEYWVTHKAHNLSEPMAPILSNKILCYDTQSFDQYFVLSWIWTQAPWLTIKDKMLVRVLVLRHIHG